MQRTKQDIYALIKKGETFHLECKKAQGGLPSSLWESYSSFCNTDGGVILLGVKEEADALVVEGVADASELVKVFWDTVHDRETVSSCVLTEKDVRIVDCDGKKIVAIDVPRAECKVRPVYIGNNAFEGTYRRNGEGDYKCTADSVESMIRDRCAETADSCVMERLTIADLNVDTIRRYRRRFARCKPTSTWNELSDETFLRSVGALGRDERRRGIVIEKRFRRITFENPGCFRMPREEAVSGGRSDARNQIIFNIFALVEIGERSGHGLSNLFGVWKKYGYPSPTISESYDPDRTMVELKLDEAVSGRVKSRAESSVKGSVESSVKSSVKGLCSFEALSASAKQVYRALCLDRSLTYVALMSKTGLSNRTIEVAIATLIKRGLLRRVGPKKGGHWEIVNPQPPTGGPGS